VGTKRITRVNELVKREVANALYRVMNEADFDFAAVTVTHVLTTPDMRQARVLISIRAEPEGRRRLMGRILRHRATIQDLINRDLALKHTPRLSFELDESIEAGDRVLGILHELERDGKGSGPDPAAGGPDAAP
jgi:ribosome-binding factor A